MAVFDPHIYIRDIALVGCGGTGSLIARHLARILWDMQQRGLQTPCVRFIDFDTVESKNVGRQLFSPQDVGSNKAVALMRRYTAIPEPVDVERHFERGGMGTLVIDAVDNHHARCQIADLSATTISCGNFRDSGQVCIGNGQDRERVLHALDHAEDTFRTLPNAYLLFPQLLEPEPDSEPDVQTLSCGDLVALGDQHLLINDVVANTAATYIYKLLHRQPIETFVSFIGLSPLTIRSIDITRDNILAYLPQ